MAINDTPPSAFRYNEKPVYTTSNGAPINNPLGESLTILQAVS